MTATAGLSNRSKWTALIVLCLGDPDDRARHDDRERRAALDPRGPRLLRDVARVGRERLPAHVRRLPAARRPARRPLRPPPAVPRRDRAVHRRLARLRPVAHSQGLLVAARAVQGLGGAVVSAVALSLIMTLFTEPGGAGQGDGRLRLRRRRRRQHRRAARRRADRRARLALDLPRQPADRRRRLRALAARAPAGDRGPAGARRGSTSRAP